MCDQTSHEVCPYNIKFAQELKEVASAARDVLAGKDERTLARELLSMSQAEVFSAFKHSPMKRAKLRGLKRNAAAVLGNVGTVEDVPALQHALEEPEPLVREHAAWALDRICSRTPGLPPALTDADVRALGRARRWYLPACQHRRSYVRIESSLAGPAARCPTRHL